MTRSSTPRLPRNALFAFTSQALPMLAGLACMPILVRLLGTERVGLLSMIWVIISYFSVLDIGISTAITRAASIALAGGDSASIPRVFWSAASLQIVMGALGTIILLICAPLVAELLNIDTAILPECVTTIRICAVGLPVVLLSGSVTGLLQAALEFRLLARYQVPCSVAQYIAPVLIALIKYRLPAIAVVMVAIRVASLMMTFHAARRLFPLLSRGQHISLRQISEFLSFGFWVTVSSIVGPILVYMDRFLIANRLGLASVAYYSVPLDAVMRLLLFSSSITSVLYPAFSGMAIASHADRTTDVTSISLKYILCCTGIIAVALAPLAPDLLRTWLRAEFASKSSFVLRILLAGIVANALARVPYALLQSRGFPGIPAAIQIASLPAQAVASISLMGRFGLSGAAMAWSGRLILETIILFYVAHRRCGLCLAQVWRASRPAALVLSLVLCMGAVTIGLISNGFIVRVLTGVAVTATGAALLWCYAFTSRDRSLIRDCLFGA